MALIGKWIDVEYKTKFSLNEGQVDLIFGPYKATYEGPLAYPSDEGSIYFKFGLYRDQVGDDMSIYFDNYSHFKK